MSELGESQAAILFGYYGASNLGDELMLVCLQRWLDAQGVRLTIGTQFPQEVQRLHSFPSERDVPLLGQYAWRDVWFRGKALRLLRVMRRQNAILAGGGDFIRDDRGWKPFSASIEKIAIGSLLGKPVCLINVGIGKPRTKYGRRLLGWVLRRCRKIIVRDRRSLDLCRELGAGGQTVLAVDIVMCLQQLVGITPSKRRVYEEPYILVALRGNPDVYGQYRMTEARVRGLAAALDKAAEQHGCRIVFLPFQTGAEDDNALHRTIANNMRRADAVRIRDWKFDLQELLDLFHGASCIVAMRLHAAILALSVERDCVVLPYDHKLDELCRQMELRRTLTADALEDSERVFSTISDAMGAGWKKPENSPASWETVSLFDDAEESS